MSSKIKPIVLCQIDGFGLSTSYRGNAVLSANPKNFFEIFSNHPHFLLSPTVTKSVNHNLYDDLGKYFRTLLEGKEALSQREIIDENISNGSLKENSVLLETINQSFERNSSLHLIGNLSSNSNRYSSFEHLLALLQIAKTKKIFRVYIHLVIDDSEGDFDQIFLSLRILERKLLDLGVGEIASVSGLDYFTDSSPLSLTKVHKVIVRGIGNEYLSAEQAIKKGLKKASSPSEVLPAVIVSKRKALGPISDFDSVVFFNHNNNALTKLIYSLCSTGDGVGRSAPLRFLKLATFFDCVLPKNDKISVIMPDKPVTSLPQLFNERGIRQLYISDSTRMLAIKSCLQTLSSVSVNEDYLPILSQDRYQNDIPEIISELLNRTKRAIAKGENEFIFLDIPCVDEMARIGAFAQAVKAAQAIDEGLPSLLRTVLEAEGTIIIYSLYGNAEKMVMKNQYETLNNRSLNPTPLIVANANNRAEKSSVSLASELVYDMMLKQKHLIDIAPTVLKLFSIPIPNNFTGKSLI